MPAGCYHPPPLPLQLDLSQLIISSFEPWAQSMIALSINASMIYFDGASNDKCLARVFACVGACVCVCNSVVWPFLTNQKCAFLVDVHLSTLTHEHVLVRLCATAVVLACVRVLVMAVGVGGPSGGTVNQCRLN